MFRADWNSRMYRPHPFILSAGMPVAGAGAGSGLEGVSRVSGGV